MGKEVACTAGAVVMQCWMDVVGRRMGHAGDLILSALMMLPIGCDIGHCSI